MDEVQRPCITWKGIKGEEGWVDTVLSQLTVAKAEDQQVGNSGGCGQVSWSNSICFKEWASGRN